MFVRHKPRGKVVPFALRGRSWDEANPSRRGENGKAKHIDYVHGTRDARAGIAQEGACVIWKSAKASESHQSSIIQNTTRPRGVLPDVSRAGHLSCGLCVALVLWSDAFTGLPVSTREGWNCPMLSLRNRETMQECTRHCLVPAMLSWSIAKPATLRVLRIIHSSCVRPPMAREHGFATEFRAE